MSHFYGTLQGCAGQATRRGHKSSGLTMQAASWSGSIEICLLYDARTDSDKFEVWQQPWHGKGVSELIARGTLGEPNAPQRATVRDALASAYAYIGRHEPNQLSQAGNELLTKLSRALELIRE